MSYVKKVISSEIKSEFFVCFGILILLHFCRITIEAKESDNSNLRRNKFLDINLIEDCSENTNCGNDTRKVPEKRYMDYRDVYGLKFDPSFLQIQAGRIDDKIDLPKNVSRPSKKKSGKKKRHKNGNKTKMEKIKLFKPPQYHGMVSPLTVVVPKDYTLKKEEKINNNKFNSSQTTDISKLQKYQKIIESLRKRMKQLQNLTKSNTTGIIAKNTQMPARFLDVFEIVEFEHRPFCESQPPPLTRMSGSCYSHKNCAKLGGLALSSCAHGYGICCVFKMTCNGFTNQEVSYFESPGYPAPSLNQLSCSMAVLLKPKTQQILLEFEFFELLPPVNGTCILDKFVVLGQNINKAIPILCGINSGQHSKNLSLYNKPFILLLYHILVYIDVFDAADRKIFLTVIGAGNEARGFRIKVTQLIERQAPPDCLQYHDGITGFIKTFNYDEMSRIVRYKFASYFNNLNYAICIKRSPGYCTITYTAEESGAVARPFQLRNVDQNGVLTVPEGQAGAEIFNCPDDHISVNSIRLCGDRLNDASVTDNFTLNAPVVDYTFGPIVIPVRTNGNFVGRGFNLRYTQNLCHRQIISV
uniref:CSON000049 protein n=1 Tax=Culicoides sonorensis TaxID=179676 RepID=A0A336KTK0_CULSO